MSYDSAYVKLVRPGESKGVFLCWKCAERELGTKINEIGKGVVGGSPGTL